jgi:16S rRNA (guanine966-N2)-methyltransferase
MRIISGKFRGRKLFSSSGPHIRPTSDRVREALFNILAHRIETAAVLDLFAGTGALGIESASRGAASVVCIDKRQSAIEAIRKNVHRLTLEATVKIIKWDIARNLHCLHTSEPVYDLVFLDPPYDRGLVAKALDTLHHSRSVKPGATLVVEHSNREPLSADRPFLELTDQRKYGKTLVSFLTYML